MGRNAKVIFRDPVSLKLFARFSDANGKKLRLALDTADEIEGHKRLPIVISSKMSWVKYQKSIGAFNTMVVNAVDQHRLTPALSYNVNREKMTRLVEDSLQNGTGFYDHSRGYFIFTGLPGGIQTDSTAMPSHMAVANNDGLFRGVEALKLSALLDNRKEMENFFFKTLEQVFIDKKRVRCIGTIWLRFLELQDVKSWGQIGEDLLIRYKEYRKTTPMARGRNLKVGGVIPSASTLNREFQYLEKAFTEAIARGFMQVNPIRNWAPEPYVVPAKKPLSIEELKKVFNKLSGTFRDICILLYVSCKRRKEIINLQIEDVIFPEHYVSYKEFKNASRSKNVHKAFHMTPAMEKFIKRIVGTRTNGSLWREQYHPDVISHVFEEAAALVAPNKNATLKNLRQAATDCMEKAGLSDNEIDAVLGHMSVSKAFHYYPDRSPQAIYRRLAERTRRGVEVLSEGVAELLK
jgi:integrase